MPLTKTIITTTIQQRQQIIAVAAKKLMWSQTTLTKRVATRFKTSMDRTTDSKILKRVD